MRGPTDTSREEKLETIAIELDRIKREYSAVADQLADIRAQMHALEERKAELDRDMDKLEAEMAAFKSG